MKNKRYFMLFCLVLIQLIITASGIYPFGFSQEQKDIVNLQTFVVSDFGNGQDQSNMIVWKARFSRFAKPLDATQESSPPDPNANAVKYMEAHPLGIPKEMEAKEKYSLGIKAEFLETGYNWIEVYPAKTSNSIAGSDGKPNEAVEGIATSLEMPGVIKSLDMWVWGGNYQYWIEFYLEDYKGFLHRLNAGSIAFIGWKNLRTDIPEGIPQAGKHVPFLKSVKLDMIKLWSYPSERVDHFYCYLSYLQVLTDVYMERFNGDDLANLKW